MAVVAPASAQVVRTTPTVYLRGDSLFVDAIIDSIFGPRARDAISSGMRTTIIYQVRLSGGGAAPRVATRTFELQHDIWEGRYLLLSSNSPTDTIVTRSFEEVLRQVSSLEELLVGDLPPRASSYVLSMRIRVNLISPEQRQRTRRWLNLLEEGSVLELFFSLDPGADKTSWEQVARFRRDDLPTEVATPDVPN